VEGVPFVLTVNGLVAGELVSLVGEFDPNYVKLFDFTRSSIRSAFDGNVVYQFETMECVRSMDVLFIMFCFVLKIWPTYVDIYSVEPRFLIFSQVLYHSFHKVLNDYFLELCQECRVILNPTRDCAFNADSRLCFRPDGL
jgi:hypothetical protein